MEKSTNRCIYIAMHKTEDHVDQRPRHKTTYTELIKYTVKDSLKIIGIGNNTMKRCLIRNALRSTINMCDLMKGCVRERALSNRKRQPRHRKGKEFHKLHT